MTTNLADIARIRKIAADAGYELTKRHGKDQFTLRSTDPDLLQRYDDGLDAWSDANDAGNDDEPALWETLEKLEGERHPIRYRSFAGVQKWLVDHHPECIPAPREYRAPHPLRAALEKTGLPLKDVTVLAVQNDPFRLDSDAGHREGAWLANTLDGLGVTGQRHLRGLHYILIGQRKPNGKPYTNTDADWVWLGSAAKAARWLGYVPFDRIIDQRNDRPEFIEFTPPDPEPFVSTDFYVSVPDADELEPDVGITGFTAAQSHHLVIVGEKSSLRPVLAEVADRYQADLYLPTGEISDTQIHTMASHAVRDGRPMVVLYFADADPAGWQMPISVSRKLQAFQALGYDFEFQLHRVALTPDQVREYGLPSTPLKDTERRADKWTAAMGVQQTEVDALAALRPDLLRQIAEDAIAPFFDASLDDRVAAAADDWEQRAREAIDEQDPELAGRRERVAGRLDELRNQINILLDEVRVDVDDFDLPDVPEVPEPEVDEDAQGMPLCDSRWSFTDQTQRLIAQKNYQIDDGDES